MLETLQEFVDSRGPGLRVDRRQAVIHGVKILGLESRNGRSYLPEALAAAASLYEGVKVNVNHPKGSPLSPRDYQERIGVLRDVALRPAEGLFADLHFNPKHTLAEQLLWDAEHGGENVGLSHNVEARTTRQADRLVVEAILKVQSVDLVADPASTRSLFESQTPPRGGAPQKSEDLHSRDSRRSETATRHDFWREATLEELQEARPDLVETLTGQASGETLRLKEELERLRLVETYQARRRLARGLLAEFGLPDPDQGGPNAGQIVGESFLAALLEAADEAAMRRLVEERARLVAEARRWQPGFAATAGRPVSHDQSLAEGRADLDAKSFARAIR